MKPALSIAHAAFIAGVCLGCGGSPVASSSACPSRHGDIANTPLHTVAPTAAVPTPPILAHGTGDVCSGNVTFAIQLASGMFDRGTARVTILLDTDLNQATGIRQGNGMGADFALDLDPATGRAAITKADAAACAAHQSCFNPVDQAPITFITDGMQVSVALTTLGSTDGRMSFQASSYVLVAPLTPVPFDFMPAANLPPGQIQ